MRLALGCAWLTLVLVAGIAVAEDKPSRTVRIVTAEAGGSNDIAARIIAQPLAAAFGQQIIVENMGAASGVIAAQTVARAVPDGYTLILYGASLWLLPFFRNNLPFELARDFAPVSLFTEFPLFLYASPSLPAQSVPELLTLVRGKPGAFNYGSTGVGSAQHFAGEMLNAYAKTNVVHISYKGIPAAMTDVTSGAIAYSFFGPTLMPMVKAGKLKVLAATSAKRSPAFPEVPTIQEGGVPNYHFTQWHCLLAPRDTPKPIIARLQQAVVQATQDRDIVAALSADGTELRGSTSGQLGQFIARELARFQELARNMGSFKVD